MRGDLRGCGGTDEVTPLKEWPVGDRGGITRGASSVY